MYETIVRYCVSICQKRVGGGCFYRREKNKKMCLDVLLAAR